MSFFQIEPQTITRCCGLKSAIVILITPNPQGRPSFPALELVEITVGPGQLLWNNNQLENPFRPCWRAMGVLALVLGGLVWLVTPVGKLDTALELVHHRWVWSRGLVPTTSRIPSHAGTVA